MKNLIKNHPRLWEVFKFLLVGGFATLIDYAAMCFVLYIFAPNEYNGLLSVFYGTSYKPTTLATVVGTATGFVLGLIFNYIFSVIFVFSSADTTKAKTGGGFLAFAGLSAVGLVVHTLGMYVGYDLLGMNEWLIKTILTAVVLVFNYFSRKYLLFNKQKET